MHAKLLHHAPCTFYLKVLLLRWPQQQLSPESRPHYVRLPESFTHALMKTYAFFFGATYRYCIATGRSQFFIPAVIFP